MKILICADIHGQIEKFEIAYKKFKNEGYDKFIQLGDLADSYTETTENILKCFYLSKQIKDEHGDNFIQLIGNHELSYMFDNQRCSGYRADLALNLTPWLSANASYFKVAHQISNYLFTHAGISQKWYNKYIIQIESFLRQQNDNPEYNMADALNDMFNDDSNLKPLCEVGLVRGGNYGNYGGPFWCDQNEILWYNPIKGFKQIVGHTPQRYINTVDKFNGSHFNNTTVTFCDVLQVKTDFLTLKIE